MGRIYGAAVVVVLVAVVLLALAFYQLSKLGLF